MNITFRDARREDVAAIVDLLIDDMLGAGRESPDLDSYLAAFDAMQGEGGNHLIIGEVEGRIVATFQLTLISGLSQQGARRAQIEAVRVAADLRGQGIGRLAMAEAERRARAAGCRMMQLTTNAERKRAHEFYERLGFTASHIGYKRALA